LVEDKVKAPFQPPKTCIISQQVMDKAIKTAIPVTEEIKVPLLI
jgi:hypothetical protein